LRLAAPAGWLEAFKRTGAATYAAGPRYCRSPHLPHRRHDRSRPPHAGM